MTEYQSNKYLSCVNRYIITKIYYYSDGSVIKKIGE